MPTAQSVLTTEQLTTRQTLTDWPMKAQFSHKVSVQTQFADQAEPQF